MLYLLLLGKLPIHTGLKKNCVHEAQPLFFPRNNSDYLHLLKIIIRVVVFQLCLHKTLKHKRKQSAMHGWRFLPGKIYLSFKTMKNVEIADPILEIVFMTKMIFYKETLRYLSSYHGWLTENKWSLVLVTSFI